MDETKGNPKDSLQTTGRASQGNEGTTPKEAKTYTEEEVNKRISDALAAKGRDAKSLELKEQSLTEREERIKTAEAKIEAAELEKLKDNPEALDLHKAKKAIKEERAALERDKAEHAEMVKSAQETQMEIKLWEIATEEKIDPVLLKDTMKNLGLTTVEQAKTLAKRLSEPAKRPAEGEVPFTPISGVTSGTRGTLTPEQFEKLSLDEKKKYLKM